ncbi:Holliday junction branch migration DNA helicase RuvB [Candidatus Saccharibacteria bacterium]|nr:Holliday junction branch migration DNA helicase RuvB [Phycisphaerae bacterium]NIV98414.1 Holliday junction branch migration DNA helicase RuvB [Candidatus Saccharibacteria bacterium]
MDELNINPKRITDPKEKKEDQAFDLSLRPKTLAEFVGQKKIKDNLEIFMTAAKQRKEPIEHVLLYGNPGLGKTTLAHIIAREMDSDIKITSGPALERVGDLAAILTNLEEGDVLFVDEIHRMNKTIEEVLYPAMEDYALDIIIGKGPSARTLRLDLQRFTIIGATTKISLLSSPLRDRFGATHHLNYYDPADIEQIVGRNAKILNLVIDDAAKSKIASRARRTPRVANRLLKRVRDFAQVKADGKINSDVTDKALKLMEVDEHGLDQIDRRILEVIIEKFKGGPVGLTTLAAATGEEISTIEDIYEPYLLQQGFLQRTPRGRTVTDSAYRHLGMNPPEGQNTLL